ncbi:MAG: DUF1761 domain-containing protein [Saprospiraceae bacterium]|nr:DUF1761 domain-containing protein [Saprospiraceae bacterium]
MELNFFLIFATGLVPLVVGALWYGPLFNKAWMKEAEMTDEKISGANMGKIYGLALLFSMFLAIGLTPIVIHQLGVFSVLQVPGFDEPGSELNAYFTDFLTKYGTNFRTFKHGALHGFLTGIFIFLPILGTNALFERKSWKYIFINVGYWSLSALIMGGIISAWA